MLIIYNAFVVEIAGRITHTNKKEEVEDN